LLNIHFYNNELYILAMVKENENNQLKLGLFRYNTDLDFLDLKLNYMPIDVSISSLNSIIDTEENIIICGDGLPPINFYYKMSIAGDSITSKFFSSTIQKVPMGIIENNNQDGYYALIRNHTNGWSSKVNLNKNLDIIDTLIFGNGTTLPDSLYKTYFVSPARMTDGSLFASGIHNGMYNFNGIFLTKISSSDSIVKQRYVESTTLTNHAIYYSNSSYNDNYYTAYTSNFTNQTAFSNDTSHIHVIKLNDDLETIWHRRIGGDAYNVLFRILATSDGGCILSIYRYEENPDYNVNAYIVKLNKDGNLLWNKEIPLKNSAILYPNPVKNELFIDLSENIVIDEINIINMSGEIVLNKTNISFPLNLNNLSNGSYILQIKTNQDLITNKFTKID
jgi:hypothetical protein